MNNIRILYLLMTFISAVACTDKPKGIMKEDSGYRTKLDFNGKYKFANKEIGLNRRNWNAEYWELQIQDQSGYLSFTDAARGLYSFSLATYTKIDHGQNNLNIYLDSVIPIGTRPWELFVKDKLDTLKHGTQLLTIQQGNSELKITYENISQLQYRELEKGFPFVQKVK